MQAWGDHQYPKSPLACLHPVKWLLSCSQNSAKRLIHLLLFSLQFSHDQEPFLALLRAFQEHIHMDYFKVACLGVGCLGRQKGAGARLYHFPWSLVISRWKEYITGLEVLLAKGLSKEVAKATSLEVNSVALWGLLVSPFLSGVPWFDSFLFSPLLTSQTFKNLLENKGVKNMSF